MNEDQVLSLRLAVDSKPLKRLLRAVLSSKGQSENHVQIENEIYLLHLNHLRKSLLVLQQERERFLQEHEKKSFLWRSNVV